MINFASALMNRILIVLSFTSIVLLSSCSNQNQVPRSRTDFDHDWKFSLGDDSAAKNVDYNDSSWRKLNLPHDWSIEGKFDSLAPAGIDGGALPGGVGWYRKTFTVPSSSKG